MHRFRLQNHTHGPACPCHYCCHEEDFDGFHHQCPACQKLGGYWVCTSSWSQMTLYGFSLEEITEQVALEEGNEWQMGDTIIIHYKTAPIAELTDMIINASEFEGFV